ncbi:MAG: GNAT family N-acetyltransferase [Chloroflexota bacterium]
MATTISSLATEDLDAETRAEIVRVCIGAHREQDFERLFSYIPSGGRHFMAYRGRELVSHAVVTTRWLHLEGERRLKTAYVDAVATKPARQGQGHATAVLKLLGTNVDDYDVACLQTDIPQFYERLGWELWRGALAGLSGRTLIPTPDQEGVMILRLRGTPDFDLDGMLTIECDPGRIW